MKIFYGINGEGLGHACRALGIIQKLQGHDVHIFTSGKAYKFFKDQGYHNTYEIGGINFAYKGTKISKFRTLLRVIKFAFCDFVPSILEIRRAGKADLWITDYEPCTFWASKTRGAGIITIDNQHRFIYGKFNDLPLGFRIYCYLIGWITRLLVPFADRVIISFFGTKALKIRKAHKVHVIKPVIRKEIEEGVPSNDGFVLVYMRPNMANVVLELLPKDRKYIVYGAPDDYQCEAGVFEFRPLGPGFTKDLLRCDRIISTAGNQLISEALFLSKPIFVIPEDGQFEQTINGYYVELMKIGHYCEQDNLSKDQFIDFLTNFQVEPQDRVNGADEAVNLLLGHHDEKAG